MKTVSITVPITFVVDVRGGRDDTVKKHIEAEVISFVNRARDARGCVMGGKYFGYFYTTYGAFSAPVILNPPAATPQPWASPPAAKHPYHELKTNPFLNGRARGR